MNKASKICIVLGLLLLAAALCLSVYNVFSDRQASDYAQEALLELQGDAQAPTAQPVQTAEATTAPVNSATATDALQTQTPDIEAANQPTAPQSPTASTADTPQDAQASTAQPDTTQTAAPTAEAIAEPTTTKTPDYIIDPTRDMPTKKVDGEKYVGVLEIPALSLKLPVMDEWSYKRLRKSPCRYTGSAYLDNMVILAHNYSSHFGRINTLSQGDSVTFTDVDGNVFKYRVLDVETLGSKAVGDMLSGDWDLTLFTCTLGGEYRVTVRCERVE